MGRIRLNYFPQTLGEAGIMRCRLIFLRFGTKSLVLIQEISVFSFPIYPSIPLLLRNLFFHKKETCQGAKD
jgi:hypothetical protein